MKKLIAGILSITLLLSITACSGSDTPVETSASTTLATSSNQTADATEQETSTKEPTNSNTDIIEETKLIDEKNNFVPASQAELIELYNRDVAGDIQQYVTNDELIPAKEYSFYNYFFYDYNHDGIDEMILYLQYGNNGGNALAFLGCVESDDGKKIATESILLQDFDSYTLVYYCLYEGDLAALAINTDPNSANAGTTIYRVKEDESFEVIKHYDEAIFDFNELGITLVDVYNSGDVIPAT